ncbi:MULTISPECIES: Crp/Fnr family transcriptional regulator [Myroides]|uniref:Cyclic nucleotide-binding domain-containing protein n=1 Tax=Myroides albus TaxID=2562892 RepID=A0A6I3LMV1_9FLAO|nr:MULTISPECIES: Crp/Fnr family transcriptional regulator [Myroides]MTG98650.1 cyclic nucleotide-binding domain-containing protein [Myroides albus]MVX37257.1 cyclic nucleotide-binding domain-containing protein [Myroides sp. LoEW2-1]UVD79213.1 Crp/Fnr family transcriptional regulator [Myroides albus]
MLRINISFFSYIETLANTDVFSDKILLQKYKPKEYLLHQGDPVTKVIVINEGITKCFITEENGKEYIPEFLSTGEIMGEIEIMGKKNCLASVEAISEVTAYIIPLSVFEHLLKTDITFNNALLEVEALRVYHTSQKASFQQLYTVEHALEKLLELQEKQQLKISKEDMASYLGITTRTLNRALKKISGEE